MKKLALALAVVAGVILYLHRAAVHEAVVDTAVGVAALAGLCLAVAGVAYAASRRKDVQPARQRAAVQPAAPGRPRAARPGDPCAEACGRPASRVFGQWPVCETCGGQLDAVAARLAGRPSYPSKTAGLAAAVPAGDDPPALNWPPVIPDGETLGTLDMSDFENRGTL